MDKCREAQEKLSWVPQRMLLIRGKGNNVVFDVDADADADVDNQNFKITSSISRGLWKSESGSGEVGEKYPLDSVRSIFAAWRLALGHSSAFVKFINLPSCRIKCSFCRHTPSPAYAPPPPIGLCNILRAIILGTSRCQLELATRCKFQDTKLPQSLLPEWLLPALPARRDTIVN